MCVLMPRCSNQYSINDKNQIIDTFQDGLTYCWCSSNDLCNSAQTLGSSLTLMSLLVILSVTFSDFQTKLQMVFKMYCLLAKSDQNDGLLNNISNTIEPLLYLILHYKYKLPNLDYKPIYLKYLGFFKTFFVLIEDRFLLNCSNLSFISKISKISIYILSPNICFI